MLNQAMTARYDVIIVGLGPAGAAAAVELAQAGARVLVLAGPPGRAKPCGGCLSARGLDALGFLDPPAWLADHPVSRLWLGFPGAPDVEYLSPRPGAYFLDRGRLDAWLAQRAVQAGAEVRPQRAREIVPHQEGFVVRGQEGAWQGRWLLGAGGAGCPVGRGLGLGRSAWVFAALVQERPMPQHLRPRLAEAGFLELGGVPYGYAWAFSRGEVLNLGLAGLTRQGPGPGGDLARRFQAFSARLGLEPAGAPRGAAIPCPDQRRPRLYQGRAAVIGDAAGLADPVLGEGIAQAVVSGRMAAAAVLAGDLGRYQRRAEETLLRDHHHARMLARLIYRAPRLFHGLARRRPGGVELGFHWLRGELAPGDMWLALARGLLGRPARLDPNRGAYYISPLG
ncbi:MAG: NAD(P)/FAD-dependent oxidoreductase [Desulfarculus sp.]|nr:MAG: NAD(P)/FAD-dependent oxidoreductase [Desulfarculus sp.]